MDRKNNRKNRKKDRQTDRQTEGQTYKQRVERDHRGKIFASLYTIIKTEWALSFNRGKINAIALE